MSDRDPYEVLVISEAMGSALSDADLAILTADPRRWYDTTGVIIADLCAQLSQPKVPGDEAWQGKVKSIRKKLERRRPYIRTLWSQPTQKHSELKGAIIAHREAILTGDYEPEPHDLALWAAAGLEGQ